MNVDGAPHGAQGGGPTEARSVSMTPRPGGVMPSDGGGHNVIITQRSHDLLVQGAIGAQHERSLLQQHYSQLQNEHNQLREGESPRGRQDPEEPVASGSASAWRPLRNIAGRVLGVLAALSPLRRSDRSGGAVREPSLGALGAAQAAQEAAQTQNEAQRPAPREAVQQEFSFLPRRAAPVGGEIQEGPVREAQGEAWRPFAPFGPPGPPRIQFASANGEPFRFAATPAPWRRADEHRDVSSRYPSMFSPAACDFPIYVPA